MKTMFVFSVLLASFGAGPARADSHCPPGQNNVWGACVNPTPGPGYYRRGYDYDRAYYRSRGHQHHRGYTNGSHCPDGQLNVWGACVDPTH